MNIQFQTSSRRSCKFKQTVQSIKRLFSFTVEQVKSHYFRINNSITQFYSYAIHSSNQ